MLTKTIRVVARAAATVAVLVAVAAQPAAAGLTAPSVSFQTLSTSDLSATLRATVNRESKQIASVSCSRTDADGTTAAVGCGNRSSSDKQTTYQVTFPGLGAGSYRFSMAVTMTDRKQASGSTTFVVAPARATCSVTPYHLTYDGAPHAATGSCTGVGGATLPASMLDLSTTVHTNPGTYPDTWSFSDPTGNYTSGSGTVTNVIDRRTQTITFDSGPVDPTVGGSYTPSATATSGLPVTFSVAAGSALICSLAAGEVSFDAAGACTVEGNQPGDTTWAAAPLVQQTFTIAPATQSAPKPVPIIAVNADDDPQYPPLPPNPAANWCPAQTLTSGGCRINALDGSTDNFFDASTSVPAGLDPSRVSWHWEIFKPPTLGGVPYASAGITGYYTPVLRILPNSLPSLTNTGLDVFWRVRLTIVVDGRTDLTTISWFRFDYQQSTLTLQMSTDCQRIGHIEGTLCSIEAANGLPATEPT